MKSPRRPITALGDRAHDALLGFGVALITVVYTGFVWPRFLVGLDEGAFVYEAKRIADGQVMYRDFFDLTGPLAQHVVALSYALFGATMETGRIGLAVLHGLIVLLMYAIFRRLAVRPALAAVCCLVDLVLFFPAFALVSAHWFSTVLVLLVYWVALRDPVRSVRRAAALGVFTALVALTQQPKGVATALAVAVVLAHDLWIERGRHGYVAALLRELAAYGAGILAVLLPVFGLFVVVAGFQPVFEAIVLTPLVAYRQYPFVESGRWLLLGLNGQLLRSMIAIGSPMLLLNVMPLIIVVSAAQLALRTIRGESARDRRPLFVALVFSASALGSILYQPNHSHFAIVGPIWMSLFAESLERFVRWLSDALHTRAVGAVVTTCLLALLLARTYVDLTAGWRNVGGVSDTPFGRVHFVSQGAVDDIEAVRLALHDAHAETIFVYPCAAALYLMTETSNPTRFQLLVPGYNTEAQFAEVEQTLERERVPFVVRSFYWWGGADSDPLLPYLTTHYEPVKLPRPKGTLTTLSLFRRKPDGANAS